MSRVPLRYNDYFVGRGTKDSWAVDIKPCTRMPKTYHDELVTNAEIIKYLTNEKIYIMYSGGIDSEYIMNIFLSLGITVFPVIVKLSEYNQHDISFAVDYCQSNSIDPIIIDIDFDKFVNSGKFKEQADKIKSPVYQYPALFDAMERLDGTIILGSDEPHFARMVDNKKNIWVYDEMERIYTISRWFELTGMSGTPAFLNWTSETLLAYQNIDLIKNLFSNKWPGRMGSNFLKKQIYKIDDRDKQDGYEIIRKSKIFQHPDIQAVVSDPMDTTVNNNGYWYIEQQNLRALLEKNL